MYLTYFEKICKNIINPVIDMVIFFRLNQIINKISSIQVSYLGVTKNFQNINHARESSIASRIARKTTTKLIMVVCTI
jgi:hypothetical protein